MQYDFEKDIENNELSMAVVNARRFGAAIRKAMATLEQDAGCYSLTREPYYADVQNFLGQMANRLEATNLQCSWQAQQLRQAYQDAQQIDCFVALQMAREATSEEERDFYAFVSNMNLQRAQWDYIRNVEPRLYQKRDENEHARV